MIARTLLRATFAGAAALSLSACMGGQERSAGFAPALPAVAAPTLAPRANSAHANGGAIVQLANGYAGLHEGNRARSVGDIVTIVLVESVTSRKNVVGATDRNGSVGITPPAAGPLDFLNPDALKAAAQGSFSGSGNASQRSSLSGAVAVTIAEVRPNGTALVVGEKQMEFSQGDEWVQFTGILRLADVDYDNRVVSTRVADARIIHSGRGAVQQSSRPGWLSRFFGAVSPF